MNYLNYSALRHLAVAATIASTVLVTPAHAEDLFLTSGSYEASDAAYSAIYVGFDSNYSSTDGDNPYEATLNVVAGGIVSNASSFNTSTTNISGGYVEYANGNHNSTTNISGGGVYATYAYNSSIANISGGDVTYATSYNTSTTNITGGSVFQTGSFDEGITNITGGSVAFVIGNHTSTTNISGGNVEHVYGYGNSATNISGGTLKNGFFLSDTSATVNFVGTDFSFSYDGYGNGNPYGDYADFFTINGTFGGVASSYNLYIRNANGADGTSDSTPRQFAFVAPAVVVPEASTFALVLPALGMIGAVVVRRRKN